MSILFLPMTLFVKEYFLGLPQTYRSIPNLFILILAVVLLLVKRQTLKERISPLFVGVVSLMCASQGLSAILAQTKVWRLDIGRSYQDFLLKVLLLFASFVLMKESIRTTEAMIQFLRGGLIYVTVQVLVGGLQLFYLFTGKFSFIFAFLGKNIEPNWRDRLQDFYGAGSYVQTSQRINGLSIEASFYVSALLIIAVPLLLACLKYQVLLVGKNVRLNQAYYLFLLGFSLLLGLFAKTSTGFLLVGLSLLIGLVMAFRMLGKGGKCWLLFSLVMLTGMALAVYLISPSVQGIVKQYVFEKTAENRKGSTIALFKTFLQHPLIGVSTPGYFSLGNIPAETTNNYEFMHYYLPTGLGKNLSEIGKYFASYGLVVMLPVFFFLGKQVHAWVRLSKNYLALNEKETETTLFFALKDMFFYFLFLYWATMPFLMSSLGPSFLLFFFFFVASRKRFEEKLNDVSMEIFKKKV